MAPLWHSHCCDALYRITFLFAGEARAQCTARDVLQNQLRLKKTLSADRPQILIKSAVDVPVWKTIKIGTFANSFALSNALDR